MKSQAIQAEIISRYKHIAKATKLPYDKKNNTAYLWRINNCATDKKVFISELGNVAIETKKKKCTGNLLKDVAYNIYNQLASYFDTEIQIVDENIQKLKKPLFKSWNETLNNINFALKHTDENINNNNIVDKKQIGVFCFSEKALKRVQETNKDLLNK